MLARSLFLIACSLLFIFPRIVSAADASLSFLAIADIHYNPFIPCFSTKERPCRLIEHLQAAPASQWPSILAAGDNSEPRYRRDTDFVLLQRILAGAKEAAVKKHIDFVLVLGDTVGHDFQYYYKKYARDKTQQGYRDFVRKTLEFVNLELAATFSDTNIFTVVGNNDTYSGNYQSVPGGDFFRKTGMLWSSLIKNAGDSALMRREFNAGGYYAVDVPHFSGVRLIVLNSVLFSVKSLGSHSADAARLQLKWLHQQLQLAKDQHHKVFIALHIPPALDVYVTRYWRLFSLLEFWQPEYIALFKTELAEFYPQIIGIFSGHLHYDWSQTLMVGRRLGIPVISVPSVSPIFGNDPGFKVYDYAVADERLDDFYTYTYPVAGRGTWSIEHAFNMWRQQALPQ